MYIAQAFKGLHEWWRYLLGIFIVFIAWQLIGMIPLGSAVVIKGIESGKFATDIPEIIEILGNNLFLFLILLSFGIGLLGLFFTVKFLHKQTILSLTTARVKIDWSRVFFAFLFWGIISSSFIVIDYFLTPENYELNFKLGPFLILSIIAILLVPIQTSFEEYLFRGYLMQGIGVIVKNKWVPLIITSVIFGLLHIANPEVEKIGNIIMVFYIGTGLFLGIITLMDEGLELALGFHAANNLFTALLVTADWTAFQTDSILKDMSDPTEATFLQIILPVFIVYPILIFIFAKKYNWTNWNDKIFGKVEAPVIDQEDYKILE